MEVDRTNRNCYNCGGFGHMAKNCRNRRTEGRIGKGKKLEYEGNNGQRRIIEGENKQNINLNGDKNLIVFN